MQQEHIGHRQPDWLGGYDVGQRPGLKASHKITLLRAVGGSRRIKDALPLKATLRECTKKEVQLATSAAADIWRAK
jgi:hypothetical protein